MSLPGWIAVLAVGAIAVAVWRAIRGSKIERLERLVVALIEANEQSHGAHEEELAQARAELARLRKSVGSVPT
jgi:predicted membrane GTPase involved in stress response